MLCSLFLFLKTRYKYMTKKKTNNDEDDFFGELAKSVGGEILEEMDHTKGFIDTGILSLNYAISGKFVGGGIPLGVCMEIYGGSSSGKTLIGTNILRGCQTANGVAILLDAERTISKEFAKKASHIDPKKLIVVSADTLEGCFNLIFKAIREVRKKVPLDKPLVIVYDSIAVSPSEREFAETEIDLETATKAQIKEAGAGADKPGERAKICGKELRKLTPFLDENNATVVFLNQIRSKVGVLFGSPLTPAGGGMALPFYCSTRLEMSSYKKTKDKNEKIIGVNVNVKNTKNKIFLPFMEVKNLQLFFDYGINPVGGLLEILIQAGRVISKGSGFYEVNQQYSNGEEYRFKSSKERNDVPFEVLLKYPKLVDAEDASQVNYYMEMFGEALKGIENTSSEEDVGELE